MKRRESFAYKDIKKSWGTKIRLVYSRIMYYNFASAQRCIFPGKRIDQLEVLYRSKMGLGKFVHCPIF